MKRRKKSTSIETKRKILGDEDNNARVSISDMPIEILMDIQSRLSIKNIFRCRSVCKLWLQILLTHDFAKLHFSRAPTCPLLRNTASKTINRALYLIELERDHVGRSMCPRNCIDHSYKGHVNMKFSTGLMLPAIKGGFYTIVNSCKGLLCLRRGDDGPIVICNPITSDFVLLPPHQNDNDTFNANFVRYGGLGFCPVTNQYKILVMIYKRKDREWLSMTLVYSLKLGTWERVGNAPPILRSRICYPAFLNGSLHWLVGDCETNNLIIFFDFVDGKFHTMLPPRHMCCHRNAYDRDKVLESHLYQAEHHRLRYTSLGVVGGKIILCDSSSWRRMEVWVMNDYGIEDSWAKMFHLNEFRNYNLPFPMIFSKPIDYLKNGELLMYHVDNTLISHDGDDIRCFKIRKFRSLFQVVAHIPSFISLKEIVGDNMEVLNVRSSSDLRKQKVRRLFLREEENPKKV